MVRVTICGQAIKTKLARSFFSRLLGLIGKKPKPGEALLIIPCKQVHTFFMQAPIDVIYIDRKGEVVKYFPGVRPRRILPFSSKTHMVLELWAGTLPEITEEAKISLKWQEL